MRIIYDLQQQLEELGPGALVGLDCMFTAGHPCDIEIVEIEDTKSLFVKNRQASDSGLGLRLHAIDGVLPGDRLSVTGRIVAGSGQGNSWGVALVKYDDETVNFAQHVSPKNIFILSHMLEEEEIKDTCAIVTLNWGPGMPLMPFYIDSIRITRLTLPTDAEADPRTVVYSLEADMGNLDPTRRNTELLDATPHLVRSGNPDVRIVSANMRSSLLFSNRVRDFDAVDIVLAGFKLIPGNQYQLTVTGAMGRNVPAGTVITFQGIPGYTWCGQQFAYADKEFTLSHVFTQSELTKWKAVRVTTNSNGATSDFSIHSITVKRLG